MTARGRSLVACLVLLVVMLGGLLALPLPYVVLSPGPAIDTLGAQAAVVITPSSAVDATPSTGKLRLTTVSVSRGNADVRVSDVLAAWFSGSDAVVPRVVVYPPDKTVKQAQQQSAQEMVTSQSSAVTAALAEIGPVTVATVTAGSGAVGHLAPGDVVTAVDGTPVPDVTELRLVLAGKQAGQTVSVAYTRAGAPATTPVVLGSSNSAVVLGIGVAPRTDVKATVGLQDVGGPSAGLMLALALVDRLTPGDLTGGRDIAGTGTIDDNGTVGDIGGIQQKLVGARDAGSTVFLVPAGNCAEARRAIPAGLRLVKISTDPGVGLHQAHAYLEQIAAGRSDQPGC